MSRLVAGLRFAAAALLAGHVFAATAQELVIGLSMPVTPDRGGGGGRHLTLRFVTERPHPLLPNDLGVVRHLSSPRGSACRRRARNA